MNKSLVQEEFGKTAASYLTSKPHALGKSLERLVALMSPTLSRHMSRVYGPPTSPRKCSIS
jgi:hypothetical protein